MNWSVWEHEQANAGDRFFMVRCGNGNTGICMSGYFSSNPYKDEDWSGRGRITYYMNLASDVMIHPEHLPILKTDELISAIPSFDWRGGHSGRLLDAGLAERLETLWAEFLKEHQEMFVIRAAQRQLDSSEYKLYSEKEITIYLNLTIEGKINAYHGGFNLDIKKS